MKRLLAVLLLAGLAVSAYYLVRLLPLLTSDARDGARVVLLHGLGRSEAAMLLLESALTEAGFEVHSFGYPSNEAEPAELVDIVGARVADCCRDPSRTVHFVGHSLGGLLIRALLSRNRPENLGRVVLIGTPNHGSELADAELHGDLTLTLLELAGPAALALSTGPEGFPASLPAPSYPVGVIAGTRDNPVSNEWLPVPNDGMVSVASVRLEGMTDFITFDVTHAGLRHDPRVATAVVRFLRHGSFARAAR